MILGAIAFLAYAALASLILRRRRLGSLATALVLMPAWFGVAFGLLAAFKGFL
jgi:hypothetical protein